MNQFDLLNFKIIKNHFAVLEKKEEEEEQR